MKKYTLIMLLLGIILHGGLCRAQINPGDAVRLTVYNITDQITGDYTIQENGELQLPFIGIIETENKNIQRLKEEIIDKYKQIYETPELTVQLLFRVYVLGEVNKPGFLYLTGFEKLTDVLALAGGESDDADLGSIYLARKESEIKIDADKIIKENSNLNDIGIKSGDRIYVPRRWWVSARNTAYALSGLAVVATIVGLFLRK